MATIELGGDEALVLAEFLSRFTDEGSLKIVHPSEQRVLWDLCAVLEKQVVELFDSDYEDKLAIARSRVADGNCK